MGSQKMRFGVTRDLFETRRSLDSLLRRLGRAKQRSGLGVNVARALSARKHAYGRPVDYRRKKQVFGIYRDMVEALGLVASELDVLAEGGGYKSGELAIAAALRQVFIRCRNSKMERRRVEELVKKQLQSVFK